MNTIQDSLWLTILKIPRMPHPIINTPIKAMILPTGVCQAIIRSIFYYRISRSYEVSRLNLSYEKLNRMSWHEEYLVLGTFLAATITLAIGLSTIYHQRKANKRAATIDVFEMLNNPEHKNAEGILSIAARSNILMDGNQTPIRFHNEADIVSRNYDQIGMLVSKGLVHSNEYYFMFGQVTIRTYIILRQWIDSENTNGRRFRTYFRDLARDSYQYLMTKYEPISHPTEQRTVQREDVF